jgi:hypothetical protein
MGGGPIHVNVDEHGSYRAASSNNWLGRSLGTNVRDRRASNLAGRNASEAGAGPKVKSRMPTRPLTGEGSTDREEIDKCTCSIRRGNERSMPER